jgi:hypothetical protein
MPKFAVGARVRKIKGSAWQGRVCGTYSSSLTPEGYAVESEREPGSVQIYPASALDFVEADSLSPASDGWTAWEGGECPVGPLVRVDVRFANGTSLEGEHAQTFDWDADDDEAIVAYRIVEARDE